MHVCATVCPHTGKPCKCVYVLDAFHLLLKEKPFDGGFPGGSVVKNLPALQEPQESWVGSLGGEDPLEEGMATHSTILAWRILWTVEPHGLQSTESQRVRHS